MNSKIVFFGTPDFATESLKSLVDRGYNVVAIVTTPDKAAGRHQSKVVPSSVKSYSKDHLGIPIFQPTDLDDPEFIGELRNLEADIFVVVAFRLLPESVWKLPRLGTFNLHASLLPKYRGAAPINWAIIRGETVTGLTTFMIDNNVDTGMILDQVQVDIDPAECYGDLYSRLKVIGAELVCKTVLGLTENRLVPTRQEGKSCSAPKISRTVCELSPDLTADEAYNFIRGLSPSPCAWTNFYLGDEKVSVKICAAKKTGTKEKGKLYLEFSDGLLEITELQVPGKKRMSASDFLRGERRTITWVNFET